MCCRAAAPHSATRRAAAGLLKCVVTSEMGWLFPARSSALQGFQGYRGFFVGFCEVMTTADAAYAGGGASCRRRRFLRFLRQRRSRGPGPGLRRWRRTRAMPVYDDGGGGRARWTATAAHDFSGGGDAAAAPAAAAGRRRTRSTTTLLAMAGRADTRSARHPDEGLSFVRVIHAYACATRTRCGGGHAYAGPPRTWWQVWAVHPVCSTLSTAGGARPTLVQDSIAVWAPHPHVTLSRAGGSRPTLAQDSSGVGAPPARDHCQPDTLAVT